MGSGVGSSVSHFNVLLNVVGKVTRECPETTTFEENGNLKLTRTDVLSTDYQTNTLLLQG